MIDKVEILVKSGAGGDGIISFRREKFVPFGGPDGGDGGNGGNVIVRAEPASASLRKYQHRKRYLAGEGGNGGGKKKHGRNGSDLILSVPPGTLVTRKTALPGEEILADLEEAGEQVVVVKGGGGGWATHDSPLRPIRPPALPGEESLARKSPFCWN